MQCLMKSMLSTYCKGNNTYKTPNRKLSDYKKKLSPTEKKTDAIGGNRKTCEASKNFSTMIKMFKLNKT